MGELYLFCVTEVLNIIIQNGYSFIKISKHVNIDV